MKNLNEQDKKLIEEAKHIAQEFSKETWKDENITSVGAALRTEGGVIYSGPNIFHPYSSPSSICAEYTAIAKAYSEGHRDIETIVAYFYGGETNQGVLSPCGKCREFMRLFGNPWIIIQIKGGVKKLRLSELLPWADSL